MQHIDDFLNSITMYKVVLYGLLILVSISFLTSLFGALPFSPIPIILSLLILLVTCFLTNYLLARLYKVPTNEESYQITALILFFLISPQLSTIAETIPFVLAGILAMSSKYILNIHGKHIFNPAAISAVTLGMLGYSISWWIATPILLPAVIIVGLLIVRKIRKFSLFFAFCAAVSAEMIIFGFVYGVTPIYILTQLLMSWPFIFFGTIMLTEPLTLPPTRHLQMLYGSLVGFLFAFQLPIGPILLSPELSLLVGNIFSYFVSSRQRLLLELTRMEKLTTNIYNFYFKSPEPLKFNAGQYVEWTLPHKSDLRGNRRYFTIASSPTEKEILLGIKTYEPGSTYKKALVNLKKGDKISVGNLSGDFVLPDNPTVKLAFLAGGIGITPFRSIIKFMIDKNETRDVVLFHTCSNEDDFVYQDVFKEGMKVGLRTFCLLTHNNKSKTFGGNVGEMNKEIIEKNIPDYKSRKFYISGSNAMVNSYKDILKSLGITPNKIVTDYFSGY